MIFSSSHSELLKFSDGKLFSNCYFVRYVILYGAYGSESILSLVLDDTSYFDFLHILFFSFPCGLRQHRSFKNARLFLGLPAKNQINPKVLMLLLSLCRLVNVVGVGCTPALSEAGRLKLLSCRAAAALVASATASKT